MSQKLTTATRSRYANAAMTNADDRTAQSQQSVRTAPFPQWGYSTIWGTPSGTVLANTENLGSRGSSKETPPSHPLASTSETEAWKTTWGPGAEASRTRNTSGSTSPNRTRDTVGRTLSSTSPYTTTAEPHAQPAIGQRAPTNGTSHWNTGTPFETSPRSQGQLQPGFLDGNSEETPGVAFEPDSSARGFRNETRAFQETYSRAGASTFPRDNSSSLGSLPNADTQSQGRHYSDTGYDSRAQSAGHSQRDSISGSFGNTAMNVRIGNNPGDDLDNFDNRFGAMSLNDGSVATPSAAGGFPKYNNNNNPAGRPFQFNPGSQSWENLASQGTGNDSRFQTIQGGASDRGFLVNGAYHQSRGSPRLSGPTPQPIRDSVYGLASRDPRSMAEANHRGRGQQLPGQHLAQLYPQQYYDPSFGAPPQLFGPGYNPTMNLRFPQAYPTQYMSTNYSTLSNRPSRDHDSADAQRSPLLRDFRIANKTNKRFELRDIYGHVVEFCGDQHGSRFIQDKLNTANSDEKDQIFKEIEPDAIPLMMDVFGNYVVQKLFEHGSQIHKTLLQKAMKPRMVNLSLDQYGCRVVQKALQHVLSHEQHELVKELEPEVLKVMKDTNGNHVIQKALERIDDKRYLAFIFSSFRGRVKELACHTCACRVLQKAIDVGPESDKASIIKEVHAHTRELTNDQYGNYVVQHILKECKAEDRIPIINSVLGDVVHLSKQKYASNVIEKCVQFGTPEEVLKIATEMTTPGPDGTVPLRMMIIDQFANYVIQKYLEKENFNKQAFVEALRPELQWARNSNYSGKNVERIAELLSKMSPVQGGQATPSTRLSSTPPTSPLQLDVGSAAPTPNLTMGPNSPSSSPPSTTESAVDEPDGVTLKAQIASADGLIRGPEVRVQE